MPADPSADTNQFGNGEFYIGYRDNPADGATPGVEAGLVNSISPSFSHDEFHKYEDGSPVGGSCFATPAPTGPCTVVMTADLAQLGITSRGALDSLTGLSLYYLGSEQQPPGLRVPLGNSSQADATAPFDLSGAG